MKIARFAVLALCVLSMPVHGGEKKRYLLDCSPTDNFVLKVTVNYDVKNLSKNSLTWYFKEEFSDEFMGSGSSNVSIACGSGSSLYSSPEASIEDEGIQISIDLKKTGKQPDSYQKKFIIPWSQLSYDASDARARITATVTWKAAAKP